MMPYLIFFLYILGVGGLIWSGMTFHEDGLTLQVVLSFLFTVVCWGLAVIGTIKIIWGDLA